jgi:hypothetical protein
MASARWRQDDVVIDQASPLTHWHVGLASGGRSGGHDAVAASGSMMNRNWASIGHDSPELANAMQPCEGLARLIAGTDGGD